MKKIILTLSAAALLISCGSSESKNEAATSEAAPLADTLKTSETTEAIAANPDLEAVIAQFATKKDLPFAITAEEIDKTEGKKSLKTKEVELLTSSVVKNSLFMDVEYALKDFYKIDSVKAKGNYKDWAESLDLGQTQRSDIYPLYKIETGPASYVLFWMMDYATVEACPYSWAKTVFATTIDKNKTGETIVFAEHSGGSDAPVSFDRKIRGTIGNDMKVALSLREELDEDEPKMEVTEGLYEIEMKGGKFVFTKEDKKKPTYVKKKA